MCVFGAFSHLRNRCVGHESLKRTFVLDLRPSFIDRVPGPAGDECNDKKGWSVLPKKNVTFVFFQ